MRRCDLEKKKNARGKVKGKEKTCTSADGLEGFSYQLMDKWMIKGTGSAPPNLKLKGQVQLLLADD